MSSVVASAERPRPVATRWLDIIRVSCEVLRRSPVDSIRRLSLTVSVDAADRSSTVQVLTRLIAAEYGLHAVCIPHGRDALTVRLTRLPCEDGCA